MSTAKDSPGAPEGSIDSPESAPSFASALEKLRQATLSLERARQLRAEALPLSRNGARSSPPPPNNVDSIRRALLVEMFRKDITARAPGR